MEFDYNKLLKDASGVLSSKNRTEERLKAVSRMVAAGFYKSIDSAYEAIIKEAWRHNLISEMLKNPDDEYSKIEKILEGEKKYDKQ